MQKIVKYQEKYRRHLCIRGKIEQEGNQDPTQPCNPKLASVCTKKSSKSSRDVLQIGFPRKQTGREVVFKKFVGHCSQDHPVEEGKETGAHRQIRL